MHDFRFEGVEIDANKSTTYYYDNHFEPSIILKNGMYYFTIIIYNMSVYDEADGILKENGDTVILSYRGKSTIHEKLFGPSARIGFYKIEFEICDIKREKDYIFKFVNPEVDSQSPPTVLKIDHKRINEIIDSIKRVNNYRYLVPLHPSDTNVKLEPIKLLPDCP